MLGCKPVRLTIALRVVQGEFDRTLVSEMLQMLDDNNKPH
jgi:hypothetical protein